MHYWSTRVSAHKNHIECTERIMKIHVLIQHQVKNFHSHTTFLVNSNLVILSRTGQFSYERINEILCNDFEFINKCEGYLTR